MPKIALPKIEYRCPLTHRLIEDPVKTTGDGTVFERSAIVEWLKTHDTHPLSGKALPNKYLVALPEVKEEMNKFMQQNQIISAQDFWQLIETGDVEKLKQMNYLDIYLEHENAKPMKPLEAAVEKGDWTLVAWLLREEKSSIDLKANDCQSIVRKILMAGNKECLEVLLSRGLPVKEFKGLLAAAASAGSIEYLEWLKQLNLGLNIDEPGDENLKRLTALQIAVRDGNAAIMRWLLAQGADVHTKNNDGATPLHEAKSKEVAELLIASGADVHAKNNGGATPLHEAKSKEAAELLITKGADVHAKDYDGDTPLHEARTKEIAELLITKGLDVHAKNKWGQTPLHKAKTKEIAELLIVKGLDVNAKDKYEKTPLHEVKTKEIGELLIAKGADVHAKNDIGWTPLHRVETKEIAELLIASGANVHAKDNGGTTPLHRVETKEIAELLIASGADVHAKDNDGTTPLHLVKTKEIAELLIASGADVHAKDNSGTTPLHMAAFNGHTEIVKLLIDHDMDANLKDKLLYVAAEKGHAEVLKLLIEHGADVNVNGKHGVTPLHMAAFKGHTEVVNLLIDHGVDVNVKGQDGFTPLYKAAQEGHIEVVKLLIAKGADVNGKGSYGETPLCVAAINGHTEVVKLLIAQGADSNVKFVHEFTPVYVAALNGRTEMVKLLIEHGADVNVKDDKGGTSLHMAVLNGHTEVVKLLIGYGADVNVKNENGLTPSNTAAFHGRTEVVKLLIDHGAGVNMKTLDGGGTSLHMAALNGHTEVVKLLIEYGADVNVKNENGFTPLHFAAQKGHTEVVKLLIAHGAGVNVKNQDEFTPLYLTAQEGHTEIVRLLIDHGADVNAKNINGMLPIAAALNKGHVETGLLLIMSKGADLNMEVFGITLWNLVVATGHVEAVEFLIDHGVDVNAKNNDEKTPLHLAAEYGHTEVVKALLLAGADKHGGAWFYTPAYYAKDKALADYINNFDLERERAKLQREQEVQADSSNKQSATTNPKGYAQDETHADKTSYTTTSANTQDKVKQEILKEADKPQANSAASASLPFGLFQPATGKKALQLSSLLLGWLSRPQLKVEIPETKTNHATVNGEVQLNYSLSQEKTSNLHRAVAIELALQHKIPILETLTILEETGFNAHCDAAMTACKVQLTEAACDQLEALIARSRAEQEKVARTNPSLPVMLEAGLSLGVFALAVLARWYRYKVEALVISQEDKESRMLKSHTVRVMKQKLLNEIESLNEQLTKLEEKYPAESFLTEAGDTLETMKFLLTDLEMMLDKFKSGDATVGDLNNIVYTKRYVQTVMERVSNEKNVDLSIRPVM